VPGQQAQDHRHRGNPGRHRADLAANRGLATILTSSPAVGELPLVYQQTRQIALVRR